MNEHGPSGAGTGPETVYAFDAMGNLESLTDDAGNMTAWTYDLLGWKPAVLSLACAVRQGWLGRRYATKAKRLRHLSMG